MIIIEKQIVASWMIFSLNPKNVHAEWKINFSVLWMEFHIKNGQVLCKRAQNFCKHIFSTRKWITNVIEEASGLGIPKS